MSPRHAWNSGWLVVALALAVLPACSPRDAVEEHRKLSLRLEHRPPVRAVAGEDAEIHALIQSSLEGPRIEAWIRILHDEAEDERIAMTLGADGEAHGTIPAQPRGTDLRYVVEARDAAGLVVSLPKGSDEGRTYHLRFQGRSSRVLGGISWISAVLGTLLFLGAGAAGAQNLRGRMSAGPAGLLGGAGAAVTLVGLLLLGAVHAYQLTGHPWPGSPVLLAISRGDLAIVTALWIVNLVLGRSILLDEDVGSPPQGERRFAAIALAGGVLTLVMALL
ncbi:MAG TPA: hypothetical protein VKU85_00935 [bacterium]|nr:hypothetical protein [bacterium]